MQRYWLIFCQAVTVSLAILFVVTTLRPDWLRLNGAGNGARGPEPAQPARAVPAPGLTSYREAVARAAPSVVNVFTTKNVSVPLVPLPDDPALRELLGQLPGLSRREASTSLGSGVIASEDGYILTNYHVVKAADAIEVALADGRQASAELVGADPETDLAVIKVELDDLPVIAFGAATVLHVGDVVLAIGNPFGVGQTTTMGIVSALGRNRLGINTYENFIQTDAAINPGNSGGALIDTQGNLVGVNTAIYSQSGGSLGIGFAIPAQAAGQILQEIIRHGAVVRGWLGVEPQDITADLARAFGLPRPGGVIIAGVLADGPAARGGVRVGDIVQTLDGQPVLDTGGLLNQIAELKPGHVARLEVRREGKTVALQVQVGKRPTRPR
ncbi:trypsin-like peptidase domain-containing protein [Orrella sp. JC864]|uniref:trypsin-like peptidase domain-containing protein n=1 Tax=Orrella sp. JC864 TaxID=3120298 RepID=UPI0012BBAF53